jgi:hypothetical protein
MTNAATKTIIGYIIVDAAQGNSHVGEPYSTANQMAAQSEMRRLNREKGTNRYQVHAVFS